MLYTDGLFEAKNAAQEEFGKARCKEFLETQLGIPAARFANSLFDNIAGFSGHNSARAQEDDITLLVLDFSVGLFVRPFSVHLQFIHNSSSMHCSSALNARKCTPSLDSTGVVTEISGQPLGPHESEGCRANQAQGQRSHRAVGVPGSCRDVPTLRL